MKASKRQLQSIDRLSSQAVFDCLRQTKDTRWVSTGLVVQAKPRTPHPSDATPLPFGLCVSASKRTAAKAVDRNRIKRRLLAIANDVLPRLARKDMDYMISGRHQTLARSAADLEKDLCWCLRKLDLLEAKGQTDAG